LWYISKRPADSDIVFIFGGAFIGFILARLQYLNYHREFCPNTPSKSQAAPGECFYYLRGHYEIGMILHFVGVLPGGLLAFLQFIPIIRHKAILFHRVNGYVVLLLSLIGVIGQCYLFAF
jgi:hypothetical protein